MKDIFCQIINNESKAEILYRNDLLTAILDKEPKTKGHTLILPNRHLDNFDDLNYAELKEVFKYVSTRKKEMKRKFSYNAFTLSISIDKAMEIDHLHFHLVGKIL